MNSRLRWIYRANKIFTFRQKILCSPSLYWSARAHLSTYLGGLADCKINSGEDWKYILIEHADLADKEFLVRGDIQYNYHKDIWEDFRDFEISPIDQYKFKVNGGGIIMHTPDSIHIGGMSNTFGASDHMIVKSIIKKKFPNKKVVIEKDDWRGFDNKFRF